ncbi:MULTISPECIES: transposase [unclassified Methanocalculus]|uniref:IS110 family transposase n=1 Tax=unclassified Methanocalculus TaxID=2631035 RepID=UPI00345C7C87
MSPGYLLLIPFRHVGSFFEATGIYWVPVYTILEHAVPTFVANPYFIKYVPSSKTDTKDAVWIAEICLEGHFKASYRK